MKVFVTGATGFIGSHISRCLLRNGHDVLALVTPNNKLWRIKDILNRMDILPGTLQDISDFQEKLSTWRPDACIHLAWFTQPGKYLNSIDNLSSLQGSINLLQALISCGSRQFIGVGTCAEYEMKSEKLAETDNTGPQTLYAASKLSVKLIGEQIASQTQLCFAWGRVFYLYGKHEDARRIIPSSILSIQKEEKFSATSGGQIRDYLNVKDVANAFVTILEQNASGVYNICSAEPVTIRFILDMIGKLTGQPELIKYGALPYRKWEPMFICGDNQKLVKLGWKPKIKLQEGLMDMITWMRNKNTSL
jgi:nucleoside-diphosphate-sugar epimerase